MTDIQLLASIIDDNHNEFVRHITPLTAINHKISVKTPLLRNSRSNLHSVVELIAYFGSEKCFRVIVPFLNNNINNFSFQNKEIMDYCPAGSSLYIFQQIKSLPRFHPWNWEWASFIASLCQFGSIHLLKYIKNKYTNIFFSEVFKIQDQCYENYYRADIFYQYYFDNHPDFRTRQLKYFPTIPFEFAIFYNHLNILQLLTEENFDSLDK
jgi:hypothetical protein